MTLPKPKQKLNKKQQELWDEWWQKDQKISVELDQLASGQLNNGLVKERNKLQKEYLKRIREAADEHS